MISLFEEFRFQKRKYGNYPAIDIPVNVSKSAMSRLTGLNISQSATPEPQVDQPEIADEPQIQTESDYI